MDGQQLGKRYVGVKTTYMRGSIRGSTLEHAAGQEPSRLVNERLDSFMPSELELAHVGSTGVCRGAGGTAKVFLNVRVNDAVRFLVNKSVHSDYDRDSRGETTSNGSGDQVFCEVVSKEVALLGLYTKDEVAPLREADKELRQFIADFNGVVSSSRASLENEAMVEAKGIVEKARQEMERRSGVEQETGFRFV